MIGVSIVRFWRMVCWQNVDFPEPGGPANKITFPDGISLSWLSETNDTPFNMKEIGVYLTYICYD